VRETAPPKINGLGKDYLERPIYTVSNASPTYG